MAVQAPKVHWDLTTPRVLTMEFCDGVKITNKEYLRQHNISADEVSCCGVGVGIILIMGGGSQYNCEFVM